MEWNKKNIVSTCKIIAFGIILYWLLQNLGLIGGFFSTICKILSPFIAGVALAFVINIPMSLFENKIFVKRSKNKNKKNKKIDKIDEEIKINKFKRLISILFSIVIIALIIIGIIFLIIPDLLDVIKEIIAYIPELFNNIAELIRKIIIEHPEVEGNLNNFQTNLENFNTEMIKDLTTLGTSLVSSSFNIISSTFSAIFNVVVMVIFAIYLLMGKEKIFKHSKRLTYAFFKQEHAESICKIARLSRDAFNNFITGQFTECIILGSLCAIGMWILRIPYAATVGTLVGITAFIPIVGAMIGAVVAIILLIPISITKAIIFVIFFIILQQTENNLIYPRVVGSSVGVPGPLVLVAVTIGGTLWGAIGMVVSLPITAVVYTLIGDLTKKRLQEKGIEK